MSAPGQLVRYADDFVVLCRARRPPSRADERIGLVLLRLQLHPTKTRLVDLGHGAGGFDFLASIIGWASRGAGAGAVPVQVAQLPGAEGDSRQGQGCADAAHAADPLAGRPHPGHQPVLRGWGQYFGLGNAAQHFAAFDSYVYRRFVLFDRAKHQRRSRHAPGLGQTQTTAGLYRLTGIVRYVPTVHASR